MPTYDKECAACHFKFTRFERMSVNDKHCPNCGKEAAERKIGAGGAIVFYGKGFHSTDYRKVK